MKLYLAVNQQGEEVLIASGKAPIRNILGDWHKRLSSALPKGSIERLTGEKKISYFSEPIPLTVETLVLQSLSPCVCHKIMARDEKQGGLREQYLKSLLEEVSSLQTELLKLKLLMNFSEENVDDWYKIAKNIKNLKSHNKKYE